MADDDDTEMVHGSMTTQIPNQPMNEVIAAVREFERRAAAASFQAGFKAGWEQATKAVEDAFAKMGRNVKIPFNLNVQVKGIAVVDEELDPALFAGKSVSEQVVTLIELRPGLRGVEIFNLLNKSGMTVLERTTRTVLWRLKNAGRIRTMDGRWYSPKSAPSNPSSQEEEADSAAAN